MRTTQFKLWLVAGCFCLVALGSKGLTLTDALGFIEGGTATSPAQDTAFVDSLVDRANGISPSSYDLSGHSYHLINDPASLLPLAAFLSSGGVGGDHMVNIGAGGHRYLLVKYGGSRGTAYVWDILGLTGDNLVPAQDQHGNTHNTYSLFNAVSNNAVPDSGSTLMLLGIVLVGTGILHRKLEPGRTARIASNSKL